VSTELLSIWRGLNEWSLTLFWASASLLAAVVASRVRPGVKGKFLQLRRPRRHELVLSMPIATIVLTTGVTALVGEPNT
jgi:hypothetical protein